MLNALKNVGLVLWMILVDPLIDLMKWSGRFAQRHPKPVIHTALVGGSLILFWMSFEVAASSSRNSVILFWMAFVMMLCGIWPLKNSRVLASNDARKGSTWIS